MGKEVSANSSEIEVKSEGECKRETPLVSVIIPVYNAEKYIKQCVDSILEQTYGNVEVICIDDGSIDATSAILQFLVHKDERVIFLQQKHLGVAAARNRGLGYATGKYISFVEADDYLQNKSYEILVQNAEEKNADIVVFGANIIGEVPKWALHKKLEMPEEARNGNAIYTLFSVPGARSLWSCFFKKSTLDKENGIKFNEKINWGEDILFLFEYVPKVKNVLVIKDIICNHRFGQEGSVARYYVDNAENYFQNWLSLVARIFRLWKEKGILERTEDKFVTWMIHDAYCFIMELSPEIRNWASRELVKQIKSLELKYYCIDWYEMEHLKELFDLAKEAKDGKIVNGSHFREGFEEKGRDPLVSVIVPTYNVDEYIKQCVDSLLDQTYKNIEVICVDDGSTDNTVPILKFMQEKDRRLKLIQQEHAGVSAARNKGLDVARGKYISFVDSDDFMQWNSYEILVSVAEKNQLDLIIFGGNALGEAPEWIQKKLNTRYQYYEKGNAGNVIFKEESARPFLWLHFIKRELIEKGNKLRFNETMEMGEDQLFQFEYVPKAESVMVLEDKLYNYRIGRNCSLMQLYEKQRLKKFDSHILLISSVIEAWQKQGLLLEHEDQLITWIVNLTYWSLVAFPKPFQPELAQKVVDLVKKYDIKDYCVAWYEKEHWEYMKDIAGREIDKEEEIREIKEKMCQERYQIQEILKSRAFKLGRLTTPRSERMDISLLNI